MSSPKLSPSIESELMGSQTPRIWTARDEQFKTRGPLMARVAEIAGVVFDEWQSLVSDVALEVYENGKWVHRTVVFVVARQNGKTIVLEARILVGLFALRDKRIYHTAQDRTEPRKVFESLAERISDTPSLHKQLHRTKGIREANGQEEIRLKDGSRYNIKAPRPASFRGPSADLIIIDEIREQRDTALWGAAFPSQRARPNPQIWGTSNAGGPDAVQLGRLQTRGRAAALNPEADRNIAYLEWSAREDRAITDREGWIEANPSLGTRITEDNITEELLSLDVADFETEILCRSVKTLSDPAIPWPAWQACGGEPPEVEAGLPRPVMAIHVSPDRTHAALAMVARRDDRLVADAVQEWRDADGVDVTAITTDVLAWMKKYKVKVLGYDRKAASTIADHVAQKGLEVEPTTGAGFVTASQILKDAVTTKQLFHRNNESLNAQIAATGRKENPEGDWWISQAKSSQTIPAVLALAFAVNLAYRPESTGGFRSLQ